MRLDVSKLTLGELATLEDLTGLSLQHISDEDKPKGKLLAAFTFVLSRRQGEPMTWKECLDQSVDEASAYLGLDDDDEDQVPEPDAAGIGQGLEPEPDQLDEGDASPFRAE